MPLSTKPESKARCTAILSFVCVIGVKAPNGFGQRGAYLEDEGGEEKPQAQSGAQNNGRKYFRVLRSLDVSSGEQAKTVQGVLENVFHGLAMKAVVETPPEEDSDVESWIAGLKQIDCLHFVEDEAEAA